MNPDGGSDELVHPRRSGRGSARPFGHAAVSPRRVDVWTRGDRLEVAQHLSNWVSVQETRMKAWVVTPHTRMSLTQGTWGSEGPVGQLPQAQQEQVFLWTSLGSTGLVTART